VGEMSRVLIVEDEEKMARMLARVLREEGHVAQTSRVIGESLASHDKVNLGFATNPW